MCCGQLCFEGGDLLKSTGREVVPAKIVELGKSLPLAATLNAIDVQRQGLGFVPLVPEIKGDPFQVGRPIPEDIARRTDHRHEPPDMLIVEPQIAGCAHRGPARQIALGGDW